jgi:anti-anti-sigma regulatory factor
MLGSECKLVGVQPAVAQELVRLDKDLTEIPSYSTLREGVSDLLAP